MSATTRRRTITRADALKVYAALVRQFAGWLPEGYVSADPFAFDHIGPTIVQDWEYYGHNAWAILWEGGPYEWVHLFGEGGTEEEFGFKIAPVALPAHIWTEPVTSWATSLQLK